MKGGAARAERLRGTPARKRREGCPRRRTPSHSPPFARLSRSTPEWGRRLLPTPFARAGRGRGGGDRCARCPVRLSGAKEGGRTFARCSAFPICAQRRGSANPARERGRKQGAPAQRSWRGGAPRGCAQAGATQQEGMGCKQCVCFPHLFCTSARLLCCAQSGEGGDSGCRREEGGRVLSLLPTSSDTRRRGVRVLFVFVFICSILSLRKQKNVN